MCLSSCEHHDISYTFPMKTPSLLLTIAGRTAYVHTCIHMVHAWTHIYTRWIMGTSSDTCTHAQGYIWAHTCEHTVHEHIHREDSHSNTSQHTCICTYIGTHMCIYTHTQAHMSTQRHKACIQVHMCMLYTRQMYRHIYVYVQTRQSPVHMQPHVCRQAHGHRQEAEWTFGATWHWQKYLCALESNKPLTKALTEGKHPIPKQHSQPGWTWKAGWNEEGSGRQAARRQALEHHLLQWKWQATGFPET